MVLLLALVFVPLGMSAVPSIHCRSRSAEWLSTAVAGQKSAEPELLSQVTQDKGVTLSLGRGRFRIRIAEVHRWDLVAALQLLKWSSRGGGFVLPRLQWSKETGAVGPGRVTITKADLSPGSLHIVLVTRLAGPSERLVWGRVLTTGSLRVLFEHLSGGTLVALFGPGGPQALQPIEILDESGRVLASGRTGPDGAFLTRVRIGRSALVVAGRGRRRTVALMHSRRPDRGSCRFLKVWLGSRQAGPGDDLALAGLVLGVDPRAQSLDVILEEAGTAGMVIGRLSLSPDGLFGGTVRLPGELTSGTAMLRIGRGRCETLAWLRTDSSRSGSSPRLWVSPGPAGLLVHFDSNRPWMSDLKGRVRLRWGWSHVCGQEPFAGGTAEVCLERSGDAFLPLSIPEGGRCLWLDALIRDRAGWHRVGTWWPSFHTMPVHAAGEGGGWFVARPRRRADRIHLDDGSSWHCLPGFGFSLCPFRMIRKSVRLAWTKEGKRFYWAWIQGLSPTALNRRKAGRRLSIQTRIEGRRILVRPGWLQSGRGGLVVLDWEGREVYKVLADVQRSSDVVVDLPRGALGPVRVAAVQVTDGRPVSGALQVMVSPGDVWHVSSGDVVEPSSPLCLRTDAAGRFLALLSLLDGEGSKAGPRHRGLVVGAGGQRPSVCLAAPTDPGSIAIRAVGSIAGRLSWFDKELQVGWPGFRLSGPVWVRPGDRVCLRLSGKVARPVSYSSKGLSKMGPWPKDLPSGALLCGLVSSDDPVVSVRDAVGRTSMWRALVRPSVPGPLAVSSDVGRGAGNWLCAGRRCSLLPSLVRMAVEPPRDAAALVSSMLARSILRSVGDSSVRKTWLAGSSRSAPRLFGGSVALGPRPFGVWMGPERLLLSHPLGGAASARLQASAAWVLVRMGRRRDAAALVGALRYRTWSRRPENRTWVTWALLETGLPLDRQGLPPGRTIGDMSLRLWVAARMGQPLAKLDGLLSRFEAALDQRKVSRATTGLFSMALALRVLDQLLPGHELGGRLAAFLSLGLKKGRGDLLARAVAAAVLWDHWDSVVKQAVAIGGRGRNVTVGLRCNGEVIAEKGRAATGHGGGIRTVRPMRCPLYRIGWSRDPVSENGVLSWIRFPLSSGMMWRGLIIVAKRKLHRPCLRIPLAAGARLSVLSDKAMGPLPAFPWQDADASALGLRICGPDRLMPGIYGLFFRLRPVNAGRYQAGRACLTDIAGPLACTSIEAPVGSKENP